MAYIDVITLTEAKNYLRIDTGFTDDDASITMMINSALSYIEQETSHYVFARNIDKLFIDCSARVYNFPINSLVSPTDAESEQSPLYTTYTTTNVLDTTLTLNVGYVLPADVPDELKQCALYIIDLFYYGKEGKESPLNDIPMWLRNTLNKYKRFIF